TASDESGMAALQTGEQLHDGGGFTVRTHREHECVVLPSHGVSAAKAPALCIEFKTKTAVAFRIIDPVLPDLHEEEQMDGLPEGLFHVLLGSLAHQADRLAALAQADRLVLLSPHVDHLLHAGRAVLEVFPAFGF